LRKNQLRADFLKREIDSGFTLYVGDVLEALAEMPDESVNCCITSPPYWGLRDYGTGSWEGGDPTCNHKQGRDGSGRADGRVDDRGQRNRDGVAALTRRLCKCGAVKVDQQIGLEATPELYVERMVGVFREVRRTLRSDGTLWLNIGDSYNAAGRKGHGTRVGHKQQSNRASANGVDANRPTAPDLKPKELVGIPWMLAFALRADGWYLRSDIIWAKSNPMPESVRDRPTKSHEYLFLLAKSPNYFYDADAIRERSITNDPRRPYTSEGAKVLDGRAEWRGGERRDGEDFTGRNKRTVWTIATQPYKAAHFATFPEKLVEPCLLAGCPEWVCATCGKPRERIVERRSMVIERSGRAEQMGEFGRTQTSGTMVEPARSEMVGWSDCGHDNHVPGTVLDPFLGSATTAQVARSHRRRAIGIELNPEYAELAVARYGSPTRDEKKATKPKRKPRRPKEEVLNPTPPEEIYPPGWPKQLDLDAA
jgi:DNA modification methylase